MVIGISASGRKNGIVNQTIEAILKEVGQKYELISLAGKNINGCAACLACTKDNRCILPDDFPLIYEKMLTADAIVFGSPMYYGTVTARAHAFIERTSFCSHHRNAYMLQGKPCVTVSTKWAGLEQKILGDPVREFIQDKLICRSKMNAVGHVLAQGYGCCYLCGFGHDCENGGAITEKSKRIGGFDAEDLPKDFCQQSGTLEQVKIAAQALKNILEQKDKEN